MNNCQTQDRDLYSCQLCSLEYNTLDRIPKDLGCGHSICLPCLQKVSKGNYKCNSCGQDRFFSKGIEKMPTNEPLMRIIEARNRQKNGICAQHVQYFKECVCLDDKCQICLYCVVHGDHKNHRTATIAEINQEVNKKIKNIGDQLNDFDKSSRDITNYLKKDRMELRQTVNETFETLLEALDSQKSEILGDIDQIYKNRITKKIKTECLKTNLELAQSMETTIMNLKSKEYNDQFFMALEVDDIEMPLIPLKEEYSRLKAECQDLNSCFDDDLQQQHQAVLNKIMGIKPIKIDFELSSPLRELAEDLEPVPELDEVPIDECKNVPPPEPVPQQAQLTQPPEPIAAVTAAKETPAMVTPQEAPQRPLQSTSIPKTPSLPLSDATNSQSVSVQKRRIKIYVQTPKRLLEIDTDVNDCIKKIKNILNKSEGISTETELVYQKMMLDENSTILSCEIKPEEKLYFGSKDWVVNYIR